MIVTINAENREEYERSYHVKIKMDGGKYEIFGATGEKLFDSVLGPHQVLALILTTYKQGFEDGRGSC